MNLWLPEGDVKGIPVQNEALSWRNAGDLRKTVDPTPPVGTGLVARNRGCERARALCGAKAVVGPFAQAQSSPVLRGN